MNSIIKIITGGQTGVDQAAMDAAQECGIPCSGWCPPGRTCESGVIPERYTLTETPHDRNDEAPDIPRSLRTEWNVRDADAVLILVPGPLPQDPGTMWSIRCAEKFSKHFLIADPYNINCVDIICQWLKCMNGNIILNIAGPPESVHPGIGLRSKKVLFHVFRSLSF